METVVIIIMLLVSFSFLLKLTFHNLLGIIALTVIAAGFTLWASDLATNQSKTQIADWLSRPELMLDTAVWLTIDVAFQICFCIAGIIRGQSLKDKIIYNVSLWIPGLLIFPVLFALLTTVVFMLPGVDFSIISYGTATALLIVIPLLSWLLKQALPETEIRIEVIFMVNLLIAALGIVATVNGQTAAVGTSEIEWGALASTLGLIALGGIVGLLHYKYRTVKQIKKFNK